MEKLPAEMWEAVFSKLKSQDLSNVYNTCDHWKNLLEETKSSWMFSQVFPLLLKYLSTDDILLCRRICKTWCHTVDSFLENKNEPFQPNCLDMISVKDLNHEKHLNDIIYDRRLSYMRLYPEPDRILKFLQEAENHPRCPFIGKSVEISFSADPPISTLCIQLLQMYGHHIEYLRVDMSMNLPEVEYFAKLIDLLVLVPKLKKLYISNAPQPSYINRVNQQLSEYMQNTLGPLIPRLPKLKVLYIPDCSSYIEKYILSILRESLESLHFMRFQLNDDLTLNRLTYLRTAASSDTTLHSICKLQAPIKWLQLSVHGYHTLESGTSAVLLSKTISHFKLTLRILELDFVQGSRFFVEKISFCGNSRLRKPSFTSKQVLEEMVTLKSLKLSGCCPVSCNFLYGIRNTLEYLYLEMVERDSFPLNGNEEIVDLLECWRKQILEPDKLVMYESNLWNMFVALKVLSVKFPGRDGKVLEFRRRVYENMQRNQIKEKEIV